MLELTRIYHFSAGHRLANAALSPEANAALYGPCHRPHGHNYYLEVTVAGRPDRLTGMAADLGQLDDDLIEPVDGHGHGRRGEGAGDRGRLASRPRGTRYCFAI